MRIILSCGLLPILLLITDVVSNDLVRLNPAPSDTSSGIVSGQVEAREHSAATWRKICHNARTMPVTHPVAVASCRSLGYRGVQKVQLGLGAPGRFWVEFTCPDNPPDLQHCIFKPIDGTNNLCRNRMVWITCEEKVQTLTNPSEIPCGSTRRLQTGEEAFFFPSRSNCNAQVIIADQSSLLVIRSVSWPEASPAEADCSPANIPRLTLMERTSSTAVRYICKENSVRAYKGAASPITLEYSTDSSTGQPPNITISAHHRLRCSITEMRIAILKSEVNVSLGLSDRVHVYGGTGHDQSQCPVPLDPDSDLIEWKTSFRECGTQYIEDDGSYGNAITIEKPTGEVTLLPGIEYTEKVRFALKCRGGEFTSHSGNITVSL